MIVPNRRDHWKAGASPTPAELAARNRVAVLTVCERLFTAAEYNRLCADMGSGKVDIRMYDDGIVLTRTF